MKIKNKPEIKLGIVAVSRDCFPIELSRTRRDLLVETCQKEIENVVKINTIIENEKHVIEALNEIAENKVNALVIYLGNFGPEGPISILSKKFDGPVMICAAAEESEKDLINGRGDAYCGLLSTCYNLDLRSTQAYIPNYPVGIASEIKEMIKDFIPISKTLIAIKSLKIFTFGPRPQDFFACNAPIKPLFDLGIEVMENSELDLLDLYKKQNNNPEIKEIAKEIEEELGPGNTYPDLIEKLAQYELTLTKFYTENLGASNYGIFAIKCWPSFEHYFGFVPCYINSRLAKKGIPVSCEVDIYGTLSEYIGYLLSDKTTTVLDINNSVPKDMYEKAEKIVKQYKQNDLFMGFHCGNTATDCMKNFKMGYQLIMHRLLEGDKAPNITRGTLEGQIKPGDTTIFRLHSSADGQLRAYIAEGEILNIDPKSFGSIGVFAIKEMGRFYRYVLLEKQFPHHTAVVFKKSAKLIFEVLKLLGIEDISYNLKSDMIYPQENPFV